LKVKLVQFHIFEIIFFEKYWKMSQSRERFNWKN
jgi:hypothetical protein